MLSSRINIGNHGCIGARYSEIINWHNSGWHWNYYSQEFWVLTQLLNLGHHYRLEQQVLAPAWSLALVWAYTKSTSWSNSNIWPDLWLINLAAQGFLALIQHDLQSDSPHRSCRFELLFGAQLLTDPTYRTMRALNHQFKWALYQAGISTIDRATIAPFNQARSYAE